MDRPRRRAALLALFLATIAPRAALAETPLAARRVLVELGGHATVFDYAEYGASGAVLDRETGVVPGLDGAVEVRGGPIALRASASTGGTTLRYAGQVQSRNVQLNGLPVTTTSGAHLGAIGAELAATVPYARGVAVLAGVERNRWDRSIRATTVVSPAGATVAVRGLSETYRWDVLAAGLRVPLFTADRFTWDAEGRIVRTLRPVITVGWPSGDVKLALSARTGWALGTTARVALGPVVVARLGFSLEQREFGESDVDPRTQLWEPRSTTRTASCELGIGARF
jgi:hypothetical protein